MLGITFFLNACSPKIDSRGYNIDGLDNGKNIKVGVDNKQTVQERLGTPSTISLFPATYNGDSWYYVAKKPLRLLFYEPKTLDQQVLVIDFDNQGIVKNIRRYKGEYLVKSQKRKTELSGHDSSILRDIFGNFGRYSGISTPKN